MFWDIALDIGIGMVGVTLIILQYVSHRREMNSLTASFQLRQKELFQKNENMRKTITLMIKDMAEIRKKVKQYFQYRFDEPLNVSEKFQDFCGKKHPTRVDIAAAFVKYVREHDLNQGKGKLRIDETLSKVLNKPKNTVIGFQDLHTTFSENILG